MSIKLSYEEFLFEVLKENKIYKSKDDLLEDYHIYDFKSKNNKLENLIVGFAVNTGGFSGGGCWENSETHEFYTGEKLPTNDKLFRDLIFIAGKESIPFYAAYEIKSLVHIESRTLSEYYGNSRTYDFLYINLYDFYNALSAI